MKYYAQLEKIWLKDEIIVYAKNKAEARMLVEKHESEIDEDYGLDRVKIFDWPPKDKFDKDNVVIIRRDKIIQPVLKPLHTFTGELLHNVWLDERDTELAVLKEKDVKVLRKEIQKIIETKIKKAKARDLKKKLKELRT